MKNNDIKAIVINLISNTIFQFVMVITSGSGFAYAVNKLLKSLKDNKINISIFTLIILIVSCVIVTIFTVILVIKFARHRKINSRNHDFHSIDDYYFSNYEKHITIYRNGNGIIIHKFTVIINNIEKFKKIRRKINIEDAKITSVFPSMEEMLKTDVSDRFDKFGFWYYTKDNIISKVKEYYWQKNSSGENINLKNNPKEMRWVFEIDRERIKTNFPYDIIYTISVPGLMPLENGKLNSKLAGRESEISSSAMNIDHKIKNLKYTISFEKGVDLESVPVCKYMIEGQDEPTESIITGEKEDDIFYNKYVFCIRKPEFNSHLKIIWKYNKVSTG